MKEQPTLTVAALIELLKKVPADKTVRLEGCDCEGDAGGVEFELGADSILIKRTDVCYCEEPCGEEPGDQCSCFCHKEKPEPKLTLPDERTRG